MMIHTLRRQSMGIVLRSRPFHILSGDSSRNQPIIASLIDVRLGFLKIARTGGKKLESIYLKIDNAIF